MRQTSIHIKGYETIEVVERTLQTDASDNIYTLLEGLLFK